MQGAQFRYVIKFVTDMNKAVKFYRDTLGLQLRFESPGWTEFATGETRECVEPRKSCLFHLGLQGNHQWNLQCGQERNRHPKPPAIPELAKPDGSQRTLRGCRKSSRGRNLYKLS